MFDDRRRYRVTGRAKEWNADDVDSMDTVASREACLIRRVENAVESHDANRMSGTNLRGGEFERNGFKAAHSRMKLSHNVRNAHGGNSPVSNSSRVGLTRLEFCNLSKRAMWYPWIAQKVAPYVCKRVRQLGTTAQMPFL